jgi:hypothetical protein
LSTTQCAAQVLLDTWLSPVAIVMSEPAVRDASTGTNAAALRRCLPPMWADGVVELPRTDLITASRLLADVAVRL